MSEPLPTLAAAFDALNEAYAARDAARERASAEIDRQFAAVIAQRSREYHAALAREAVDEP